VQQAQTNSQACPWHDRLAFHTIELQQLRVNHFFDLIVTNPPYFDENKTANRSVSNNERIQARQTTALSYADLLEKVVSLLSDSGCFHCVLPAERTEEFIKLAEVTGLFCQQQLEVRARPETKVIRSLLTFVRG
jgi:tRNA1Val (adenine37-N6)-methyltransferase